MPPYSGLYSRSVTLRRRQLRRPDKFSQPLPEGQGQTYRDLHRRRRRGRSPHRRSCRWRQRRTHRCSIGCRCGNRGSGLHRGEGDCPARRVRAQLQTHRTPHHQDVAIITSHPRPQKAAHPGDFSGEEVRSAGRKNLGGLTSLLDRPQKFSAGRWLGLREALRVLY